MIVIKQCFVCFLISQKDNTKYNEFVSAWGQYDPAMESHLLNNDDLFIHDIDDNNIEITNNTKDRAKN